MIQIQNLTKIYKLSKRQQKEQNVKAGTKIAVNNVSMTIEKGKIHGILGTNGAGKTTMLRCMATLLKPTEGTITVNGADTVRDGEQVRRMIGFLTNEIKLDPQFRLRYLVHFFGQLHGMDEEAIERRKTELFDRFGITEFQDKLVEELSTGMKQKAAIALSPIHDPEVIIFDEPTSGLDIITARAVTDYLLELKKQGKTIVISTHIMSEAEKLCDRISIIMDGKKEMEGSLEEILQRTGERDLEDAFFALYCGLEWEKGENA